MRRNHIMQVQSNDRIKPVGGLAAIVMLLAMPLATASAETWDVVFDGTDSAADNVANYLRWDSAIDDDWNTPGSSFKLNAPSVGYMSVDRVTNSADHNKTGNIWRRDPILSHAAGFTMEVGVKINPNSQQDAFSMTYLDDGGSFGVHLSPNRIKVGNLAAGGSGVTTAFNTTSAFHTYRIVKQPNSYNLSVYIDGSTTPIITGSGNSSLKTGSSPELTYPRILIGDNENQLNYNANYVLDFVQYRRGATAPGQAVPVLSARQLPPAPAPAPADETWSYGYYGTGEPIAHGWNQAGGSVWVQRPEGVMELWGTANARLGDVVSGTPTDAPGWRNRSALTLEARIKVLPDSEDRAFNLVANDQLGQTALVLSPGKVELMHAYSPVGEATVAMDTTDDFHIYRMTRDVDGLYWHLYIDGNPLASIPYQQSGGDLLSFSRIWFGDLAFPTPGNMPHVLIDYIRWHEGAAAPVPEPTSAMLMAACGWLLRRKR